MRYDIDNGQYFGQCHIMAALDMTILSISSNRNLRVLSYVFIVILSSAGYRRLDVTGILPY